jgi:hypothetical protein
VFPRWDELRQQSGEPETVATRALFQVARLLKYVLPRRLFSRSLGALYGQALKAQADEDHSETCELAFRALHAIDARDGSGQLDEALWWAFLRLASDSANINTESRTQVELLLERSPAEQGGYDPAYCYASMARWKLLDGDQPSARRLAQSAVSKDPTWPYPEVLLACCSTTSMEVERHLRRALALDPAQLDFIRALDELEAHPDVLRRLEQDFRQTE